MDADRDTLERLVDRRGIGQVVGLLADVCTGKAALPSPWQDEATSRVWGQRARSLSWLLKTPHDLFPAD